MSCGWEGNRRSVTALFLHHRLNWFIHLWARGIRMGDKHPTYTAHWVWYSLPFTIVYLLVKGHLATCWRADTRGCVCVCVCVCVGRQGSLALAGSLSRRRKTLIQNRGSRSPLASPCDGRTHQSSRIFPAIGF